MAGAVSLCSSARPASFPHSSRYSRWSGCISADMLFRWKERPPSLDWKSPKSGFISSAVQSLKNSRRCPSPKPDSSSPRNCTLMPRCRMLESCCSFSQRLLMISFRCTTMCMGPPCFSAHRWISPAIHQLLNGRAIFSASWGCHCNTGIRAVRMSLPTSVPLSSVTSSGAIDMTLRMVAGSVASARACSSLQHGSSSLMSLCERSSHTPLRSMGTCPPRSTSLCAVLCFSMCSSTPMASQSSAVEFPRHLISPAVRKSACGWSFSTSIRIGSLSANLQTT
mmetsp:Transcript_31270/g.88096  ORF Transcript_31270/g.88096 Transcript_31270/m.88096 type:complete len:280 (+) Transcript_31270:394-1233(+)